MRKASIFLTTVTGLVLVTLGSVGSVSPVKASQPNQVIQLFNEQLMIETGPVLPDPVIRETTTATVVLRRRDTVLLSSTADGTGTPNVDDFITINGHQVLGGFFIEGAVKQATDIDFDNTACVPDGTVSVNRCNFPRPHHHPVDVSDVIPRGFSTITVDIWDFGGGYGHTELYLVVLSNKRNHGDDDDEEGDDDD